MIKKTLILIAFIILGIVIFSIINNSNNDTAEVKFIATVLENRSNSLLVEPVEGSDELRSSDKISVRLLSSPGTIQDVSEFAEGSRVEITYDGMIMESYPAQINASRITSVE